MMKESATRCAKPGLEQDIAELDALIDEVCSPAASTQ